MTSKKTGYPYEIVYGIHPIIELLRARKRNLLTLYTTKPLPKAWKQIEPLLPQNLNIQYVHKDILNKLAEGSDHQGFVAYAKPFIFRKKFFDSSKQKALLLIDGVQDTRNLGGILRSAHCTNIDGVIICKKQGAPLNGSTLKASAGLAEHLEIYVAPSAHNAIQELKNAGYTIYMAALGGKDATKASYNEPLCLVIGNEATGISKELLPYGEKITLPQKNSDISYNASVAAGILLFWIANLKKRF